MTDAFQRLHADLQRSLWDMQWRELRPLQSDAINAWFDVGDDLLLMAHTAAGKTEAAFLPVLSSVAADHGAGSFRAMYVGPLKALINDQFRRLDQLCERAEIPVHRWHGDVDQGKKKKALKDPGGVLLITPESLEAMLMLRGRTVPQLFSRLEAVVVDELHVFLDSERGRQLSSLLHRLDLARGQRTRRVGLSATIGSPDDALRWMADGGGEARLIESGGGGEIELIIKTFMSDPRDSAADDEDDGTGGLVGVARHLHEHFRGKTNLVFCNRKNQIEELSDLLARIATRGRVENEFRVHHGSLSRDFRHEVENELQSAKPRTALCSSTLELGIDVGECDAVGQVEPPHSVSSLRQRLGRSGRREGSASKLWMYIPLPSLPRDARLADRLHQPLIRAIAEVELMLEPWVEPVAHNRFDLSTLIQQTLSMIKQTGGLSASDLYEGVCRCVAFSEIPVATFTSMLRDLAAVDLIEQTATDDLILGLKGEKLAGHYDFYAAFATQDEWDVLNENRVIGSIVPSPSYMVGSHMLLAGKRWTIAEIDMDRRVFIVKRSNRRLPLIFPSMTGHVHARVRRKMLEVLLGTDTPTYIDAASAEVLRHARATAHEVRLAEAAWLEAGDEFFLVTLGGSRENQTLAAYLAVKGVPTRAWPGHRFELGLAFDSGYDQRRVMALLRDFVSTPPDPAALCRGAHPDGVPPVGKHTHFLGDELRAVAFAASNYDVAGAAELAKAVMNTRTSKSTSA